jgi:hypothetical protein
MVNAHKFEELFHNTTEDGESIDGNVDKMNELLTDIFEIKSFQFISKRLFFCFSKFSFILFSSECISLKIDSARL